MPAQSGVREKLIKAKLTLVMRNKFDFLLCLFGLHLSDVFRIEEIKDPTGKVVQLVLINRCTNCGKLSYLRVDLTYKIP